MDEPTVDPNRDSLDAIDTPENDAEWLPEWVNPTTLRGLAFTVGGLLILTVPDFSQRLLGLAVAIMLVVIGATRLWGGIQRKPVDFGEAVIGVAFVAAGVGMVLFNEESLNVITKVLGGALVALGLYVAVRSFARRASDDNWVFNLVRGLIYASSGAVVAILPDAIASSLVLAVAGAVLALGIVTLAIGMTEEDAGEIGLGEMGRFVKRWLESRDLGDEMRDSVVDSLFFEEPGSVQKQVGFWVLLVLSVAIATLGVLADSTAVVIGAMLVAPLMTPIMATSAAIVNGWVRRVSTAMATVAGGVVVAISAAWIIAAWAPQLIPLSSNSQVLSRVSPTLIDMMIAVAAGAAGAYATIDKRVSSSITGVAIAVALVPPLGVVGVMLHATLYADALGAFLLFLTNLVSIILVASIVFVIGGLAPISEMRENSAKMRTTIGTVLLGALIIVVPLAFTSNGIIVSAARQSTAQSVTAEWISGNDALRLNRVAVKGNEVSVVLTGRGDIPDIADLEAALEDVYDEDVSVSVEYFPSQIITSDDQ